MYDGNGKEKEEGKEKMDKEWLLIANRRNIAYVTIIMDRMRNGYEGAQTCVFGVLMNMLLFFKLEKTHNDQSNMCVVECHRSFTFYCVRFLSLRQFYPNPRKCTPKESEIQTNLCQNIIKSI